MAKDAERRSAKYLYVHEGRTAKEISASLGLSENTVGKWVKDGAWREERSARQSGPDTERKSIQELLEALTAERVDMQRTPADERTEADLKRIATITNEIATFNKRLETIAKHDGKVTLEVYLRVMDKVFKALQLANPKAYLLTVDFQEEHLREVARELGS